MIAAASNKGKRRRRTRAFLLVLVLMVLAMASLAALNFSRSMLVSHESSRLSNGVLQARLCAESGAQSIRLMMAYPKVEQNGLGGFWDNPALFQAINVIPDADPARRGNYSVISSSLDQMGAYAGIRYGLQNESAKLNLNALAQLDELAAMASNGSSAVAGSDMGGDGEAAGGMAALGLASATSEEAGFSLAASMLMKLPGMTQDVADAILDWLDEDDVPRPYGAEFSDYYSQMQPAYEPANGPIDSVEQLLLVRGVTPQLLFGYDENRNGLLDPAEQSRMASGIPAGMAPGQIPTDAMMNADNPPAPLGIAAYLTLHSQEANRAMDGTPRININSDDLQVLYDDLVAVLGNETWASFIVAYRVAGSSGASVDPIAKLLEMVASESGEEGSVLATQLSNMAAGGQAASEQRDANAVPWSADLLSAIDLNGQGQVNVSQVLDLVNATVTLEVDGEERTFSSPFTSEPLDMANYTPVIMDYLTTVSSSAIPGRINIMECPREILIGIPGITPSLADEIISARTDGSESETRFFETWLAIEGYLDLEQMRGLLPLVTCGGDAYKAQIIGYLEGNAAFSRIEVIVNGAAEKPTIQFFRRLDHLGRGFDVLTLGQRFDAVQPTGAF